jgi:hypothetical protein
MTLPEKTTDWKSVSYFDKKKIGQFFAIKVHKSSCKNVICYKSVLLRKSMFPLHMAKAHYAIWSEHNKLVFSYKTESASPRGKKNIRKPIQLQNRICNPTR